jgi:low affinity Fe/Cu permease
MVASRQTQGGQAQREEGPAVRGWRAQLRGDSVAEPGPPAERSRISRWLSRADRYASRPLAAVLVIGGAGVWILVSIAVGFPTRWETIFQTLVAALTLAMVFVIQHTQARHQRATQRKLDEILLAMPSTDNSLLTLEHASDEELRAAGHEHREIRQAALDDHSGSGADRSAEEDPAQRPP